MRSLRKATVKARANTEILSDAQNDDVKQTKAKATANAGILRYAQDDRVKNGSGGHKKTDLGDVNKSL
jgi:hypothetical protein